MHYLVHLLNIRICRYTYITPTVFYCDQDRYVIEVVQLCKWTVLCSSQVFFKQNLDTIFLSLSGQPDYV